MLLTFSASAQQKTSLMQVYYDAIKNDPTYLAKVANKRRDLTGLAEAKSHLLPTISAFANRQQIEESLTAPQLPFVVQGSTNYSRFAYGIEFSQVIFNRELFASYSGAKIQASIDQIDLLSIHDELILKVANAYFEILSAEDAALLANANVETTSEHHDLISEQLKTGSATNADLQLSKARWLLAVADQTIANNQHQIAMTNLAAITGKKYPQLQPIKEPDNLLSMLDSTNNPELVIEGNLDYIRANLKSEIAKRSLISAKAKRYPTVELVMNYGENDNNGSLSGASSESSNFTAMLQASIPIFQGGRTKSSISAAKHGLEAKQQELKGAKVNAIGNHSTLISEVRALHSRILALNLASEASQLALDSKRKMYEAGVEDNLSILDAQRDAFQTRLDERKSFYEFLSKWLEYQNLLGALTEKNLSQFVNTPSTRE